MPKNYVVAEELGVQVVHNINTEQLEVYVLAMDNQEPLAVVDTASDTFKQATDLLAGFRAGLTASQYIPY